MSYQYFSQKFNISVVNLIPLTRHYLIMDDLDWSNQCLVEGQDLGDPLITDDAGAISFEFYWSENSEGSLDLNTALSRLFDAVEIPRKTWVLTNISGTSQARGSIFNEDSGSEALGPQEHTPTSNTSANAITQRPPPPPPRPPVREPPIGNTSSNTSPDPIAPHGAAAVCQTFFVDPELTNGSSEIFLSSIYLYNKRHPNKTHNKSGIRDPGVTLFIVPCINETPRFGLLNDCPKIRKEYNEILPSLDASHPTIFTFQDNPVLETGKHYGMVLVADGNDPDYTWWAAKIGQLNILTKQKITSLGNRTGQYFELSSSGRKTWQPIPNKALKYDEYCLRFSIGGIYINDDSRSFKLNIGRYEFAQYDVQGTIGKPKGGEFLYMPNPSHNGRCSVTRNSAIITSTNANFTTWYSGNSEPNYIVLTDGRKTNIKRVIHANGGTAVVESPVSFTNSATRFYSTAPVARVYMAEDSKDLRGVKRRLVLSNSTANSSMFFSNGGSLIGAVSGCYLANTIFENIIVTEINPRVKIDLPAGTKYTMQNKTGYSTSSNGTLGFVLNQTANVQMYKTNIYPEGSPRVLMSRSNEVQLFSPAYAADVANSSVLEIDVETRNDFVIPVIKGDENHVFYTRYFINNDYTNENTNHGNAISKAVSNKVNLASGQFSEDLLTYIHAYRPSGTNLLLFAKLYNSADPDAFTDKDWTKLELLTNKNTFSSYLDFDDLKEYSYGLPLYPNSAYRFSSTVTTVQNETNVTSASAVFQSGNVAIGDVVKIYQSLFPNTDYMVASVVNVVSNTVITIDQPVSNLGVVGAGLSIDLISHPQQAFRNILNSNVVRYYTETGHYHDTYNSFAVKIVFQSNNLAVIPFLSSVRSIAVSA